MTQLKIKSKMVYTYIVLFNNFNFTSIHTTNTATIKGVGTVNLPYDLLKYDY